MEISNKLWNNILDLLIDSMLPEYKYESAIYTDIRFGANSQASIPGRVIKLRNKSNLLLNQNGYELYIALFLDDNGMINISEFPNEEDTIDGLGITYSFIRAYNKNLNGSDTNVDTYRKVCQDMWPGMASRCGVDNGGFLYTIVDNTTSAHEGIPDESRAFKTAASINKLLSVRSFIMSRY